MGSSQFSLNGLDLKKVAVHFGIFLLGQLLVFVAPLVANVHFSFHGQDYSALAGLVLGGLIDLGRKYVASNSAA